MTHVVSHRPPAVGVSRNPLIGIHARDMQAVRVGVTIASLVPKEPGRLICVLNGSPLPRLTLRQRAHHAKLFKAGKTNEAQEYLSKTATKALNWQRVRTAEGDVVEWHVQPQDKEDFRIVLQIAAVIINFYAPGSGYALLAAFAVVAYNLLVPPTVPPVNEQEAAGSVFNTSLGGNQARLDQPIWRSFGRVKIAPPFAAAPYYEYVDPDGDNLDNDQYYYAVFAVGYGNHDLENAFIGRTPVSHFQDVLRAEYLAPGVLPSVALCNVVTAGEVSQLDLEGGRYIGGYAACQPTRRAESIGIDVLCPQGLGNADGPLTVSWRVEVREINDYGFSTSAWRLIGNESRTAETNTPQRWSVKYLLTTPARVEVRLVRTDVKDTSAAARHSIQWIGLRAYLDVPAPLNPNVAHYEVVMRASEQLSASSQRDFTLVVWPLIRTWHPDTGWGAEQRCRTPAWAIADLWTNSIWGEGLPDSRVDLQGLYDFSLINDERQDRFDYTFANPTSAWEAAQLIARTGRARCFRRYGVNTLARDEWYDLPTTALTPRNTVPDSMVLNERLPVRDTPDGIVIQYRSNVTWDTIEIECPCPGFTVTDPADPRYNIYKTPMSNPVYKFLDGVTGAKHAEREGLYDAADMLLRRRVVGCTTEMQGVITAYMMPVLWQPDIAGYGQSGDVAFWDEDTLVMGLTEMPVFGVTGQSYLTLIRDDGTLTAPVLVSPGPTEWDVVLPAVPDFDVIVDDGARERPKFVLGDLDLMVKISAISDGGKTQAEDGGQGAQLYEITAVVDDERVHTADNHLLPGPGDIQDPVDGGEDVGGGGGGGGGGEILIPDLTPHTVNSDAYPAAVATAEFVLTNDGYATSTASGRPDADYPNEWMRFQPVEVAQAALFEVRATWLGGYYGLAGYPAAPTGGDVLDTWLSLATNRSWQLELLIGEFVEGSGEILWAQYSDLRIEIRDTTSLIVQASATIRLRAQVSEGPFGI